MNESSGHGEQQDDTAPDDAARDDAEILREDLRRLLGPDDALGVRTADGLDRRLRSGSAVASAVELLGIGWWTVREILTDPTSPADGEQGDRDG